MEINFEFTPEFKPDFRESLKGILDYIKQNSYQNSLKFEKEIVEKVHQVCENPEAFPVLRKIKTKKRMSLCYF